ncbi:MAG: hypothetical protein FWD47_05730 [Treponema sp.]|nr:hypothetical protein [Treponema sp.]
MIERSNIEKTLLDSIKINGKTKHFTQEEIIKTAKRYSKFSEESEMKERLRRTKALNESSRIYFLF